MAKKVIIIDDSITSLNLLKNRFTSADWDVYGTSSAKDGYAMVFDVAPDLIITDAIMPLIGGFQFVRMLRDNPKTSKIPVIIYSVLPENNAKFYLKRDSIEYFLSKNEDIEKLISLSENVVKKHPIDEKYKFEILKSKFMSHLDKYEIKTPDTLDENTKFDRAELEKKFKEKYNFKFSNEKIFEDFFKILYPVLKYELCIVFPKHSFGGKKTAFFDIKDIILSPIFQKKMLEKFGADDSVLYKKYAPNMNMIAQEDEFHSKIEFNFEFKDKPLADVIFYSREKSKWQDFEKIEIIKNVIHDFFRAYYVNKSSTISKKDSFGEKYFGHKFNILNTQESSKIPFIGVISISNYTDVVAYLPKEETDLLNSKISEMIMKYLSDDERVIKNDEDEYTVIIQVTEYENAVDKFNFIISILEQIKYNNTAFEAFAGICECGANGNYDIFEAQKNAYKALEKTTTTEKTVIYNATK